MKAQGLRTVAIAGVAGLLLLAGTAWPRTAANAGGGPAGEQGVSYSLDPERPTAADDIVVNARVSDDQCYSLDGVELMVSEDAVDIRVVAHAGDICPAIPGPFEMELPVHIGQLAAGMYALDVSFSVCVVEFCSEIGIGGDFDVVPVGDANCDGVVNSIDANVVLQQSARLIGSAQCAGAADANRDGAVQSIDATLILQYEAGLLGQLPPG